MGSVFGKPWCFIAAGTGCVPSYRIRTLTAKQPNARYLRPTINYLGFREGNNMSQLATLKKFRDVRCFKGALCFSDALKEAGQ